VDVDRKGELCAFSKHRSELVRRVTSSVQEHRSIDVFLDTLHHRAVADDLVWLGDEGSHDDLSDHLREVIAKGSIGVAFSRLDDPDRFAGDRGYLPKGAANAARVTRGTMAGDRDPKDG